jgi:ESS family glutamate:Na+ symporter
MNTNPTIQAILLAAGLLAIGLTLRLRLRILRLLYIPASVVAGAIGLGLSQSGKSFFASYLPAVSESLARIASSWSTWPATLIAVVFAALLLERPQEGGLRQALLRGLRSGILAWIIILGQILIGLIVYLLAVRPTHPAVPVTFSQMLEISWAGGHGSAAGMGALYAHQGFAEGRDIAFFCATMGLIYGVLSGLVLVNLAIRKGWTFDKSVNSPDPSKTQTSTTPVPIAFATIRNEVMEPITIAIIVLAAAVAVGMGLQQVFLFIASLFLKAQELEYAADVPLFLFTLLGGWIVRQMVTLLRIGHLIDAPSIQRFVGISMDFLIVAGIATMRIESISRFGWSLLLLMGLAAIWSVFCLLLLSRWLLPKAYWFELGLLNFGFSTANTPQGMMLLRIVDPELRSNAAADYAVAAPLSAPFIGGGIVTFLVLPVMLQRIPPLWMGTGLLAAMISLLCVGLWLAKRE